MLTDITHFEQEELFTWTTPEEIVLPEYKPGLCAKMVFQMPCGHFLNQALMYQQIKKRFESSFDVLSLEAEWRLGWSAVIWTIEFKSK